MLSSLVHVAVAKYGRAVWAPDSSRILLTLGKQLAIYTREGKHVVSADMPTERYLEPFVYGMAWSEDTSYVAVAENPTLRLRRTSDLAIVAEHDTIRMGRVAFCESGRALAIGAHDCHLHILDVPALTDRGSYDLEYGDYESFDIDHVAADPTGTFVATADYGGYSEDEWGHTADRGIPKLAMFDSTSLARPVSEITQPQPITHLVFDRWRRRIQVGNYKHFVVRDLLGAQLPGWSPYGKTTVKAIGVCERYIATLPDIEWGAQLTLDLWDPETYAPIFSTPIQERWTRSELLSGGARAVWPSPDGTRIALPEPGGLRIWSVAL